MTHTYTNKNEELPDNSWEDNSWKDTFVRDLLFKVVVQSAIPWQHIASNVFYELQSTLLNTYQNIWLGDVNQNGKN